MTATRSDSVLGGLSPEIFLRDYWGKRPLVVRGAIPGFAGLVSRDELLALATRGDAVSRLVIHHPQRRRRWERHDGPFGGLDASMLPPREWTLLVHGVESLVRGGWELLRRFSFIPAARVDDLMISYASDGGGVGPHDDRYDVFLLQGPGRRRWQLMHRGDRSVDPNAAIRVLANFSADEEHVLDAGDMLYLPPGVAHWGVAEGECFTYSIGFLAPSRRVLVESFLGYLAHTLPLDDALLAADDRAPPEDRLALPEKMVAAVGNALRDIRWDAPAVADFAGRFLTSPKPHHVFTPPRRPLSAAEFSRRLRAGGRMMLALPTRALLHGDVVFINGESARLPAAARRRVETLLDTRSLPLPIAPAPAVTALLHRWYVAGWLGFGR